MYGFKLIEYSWSDILTALIGIGAILIAIFSFRVSVKQQFETTFFNFLQSQRLIVSEIEIKIDERDTEPFRGRIALKKLYQHKFQNAIDQSVRDLSVQKEGETKQSREDLMKTIEFTLEKYIVAYNSNNDSLGHYFRSLYHLVRLVDESKILSDHESKMKYIRLIRAQLSIYELALLFYNSLSVNGSEKFKPLIERYHLLKNLDDTSLIRIDHKNEYQSTAFSANQ